MTLKIQKWDAATFVSEETREVPADAANVRALAAGLGVGEYREVPVSGSLYLRVKRVS